MSLWILLALLTAASGFGFAILWRRQSALGEEVVRLRAELAARDAATVAPRRRARSGEASNVIPVDGSVVTLPNAAERSARGWRLEDTALLPGADLQPEALRGLGLGLAAALPALGFFLGAAPALVVATGLSAALAMTLLGLRPQWRATAWAGVITAAGWGLIGFTQGAAHAAPVIYSVFLTFCGIAGLVHAHMRRAAPGSVTALTMATLALALASQIGVIGPAGAAFGCIIVAAAIIGALSLRLESLHLAAFGAALIGLFVLSGQDAAAIWFTPAASWAGALFLAIAFTRVPQLGPRGVALAGTGALAPLLAISALHFAQHGLADPLAAAGAFAALAGVLGALIAVASQRRRDGLAALKVTLWVLTLSAFTALAAAITLALPAPLAAPAFALVALGLIALNTRVPDHAWRLFAMAAAVFAAFNALQSGQLLLAETPTWPAWALVGAGLFMPAAILAATSSFAGRTDARLSQAILETFALTLAIASVNLLVRLFFSAGATLMAPIGFVEAGAHISVWLFAALTLAARSKRGASSRMVMATALAGVAVLTATIAGALWLTQYWIVRDTVEAPISYTPLGFLAPAIMFFAHWVFWRARGSEMRTRVVFGSSAAMAAGFIALETLRHDGLADWARALIAAVTFALAIIVNFAPGVVGNVGRHSDREEDFHRERRRQKSA